MQIEPVVEPLVVPEAVPGAVFAEAAPLAGAENILLVDDEVFVRKAAAEVLKAAGYGVVTAANAAEALAAWNASPHRVDLLLADVVMPGMSGRDLAIKFKGLCPHGRVLLMSGYADQFRPKPSSLHLDCDRYLNKPFSMGALLSEVREVLDAVSLASAIQGRTQF